MTVTPYTKTNEMKQMECYLHPGGLLHDKNTIISNIIVFNTLCSILPLLEF